MSSDSPTNDVENMCENHIHFILRSFVTESALNETPGGVIHWNWWELVLPNELYKFSSMKISKMFSFVRVPGGRNWTGS